MDQKEKDLIEDLTRTIIREFGLEVPAGDIKKEIEKLGGHVEYVDRTQEDGVCSDGNGGFILYLREGSDTRRQAFRAAQELGCLFMTMGYQIDRDVWNKCRPMKKYHSVSDAERNNYFAAALMMPEEIYRKSMERHSTDELVYPERMMPDLGMPSDLIRLRGMMLGVLDAPF